MDLLQEPRCQQNRSCLALRPIRDGQDHQPQEDTGRPDPDPRIGYPEQGHDRHGIQAWRPGRVLP